MAMTGGADRQFNYFSAKGGVGMHGGNQPSNEYDEEDVAQLEKEIENVMRRSNLGNSSLLHINASNYDDKNTVNMTVLNDSFAGEDRDKKHRRNIMSKTSMNAGGNNHRAQLSKAACSHPEN
eukprot:CAMPEP_0185602134 /NCGR_PEP_ID=MMETSP0436-20130131/1567_1 /TAXON_ID=626734 ORGANISM="Favella taraikaensis, Strain Fe Narragansett Bay" /NCGR_SAMPLE_ID=MMETSP0436 /ASSEMBLY_ACC=CAM_ASM_000390 /LENGTH=121 /DNA_ID=CAMNT_0028232245 /DNA_START=1269 /DNA_END=1635 /DNA_ORIENTATION=-